jgi:hypothetical protein
VKDGNYSCSCPTAFNGTKCENRLPEEKSASHQNGRMKTVDSNAPSNIRTASPQPTYHGPSKLFQTTSTLMSPFLSGMGIDKFRLRQGKSLIVDDALVKHNEVEHSSLPSIQ